MLVEEQNLALISGDPDLLNGIDAEKLKASQFNYGQAFKGYMEGSQKCISMGSSCISI